MQFLICLADDFVLSVTENALKLCEHRNDTNLAMKDLDLLLGTKLLHSD